MTCVAALVEDGKVYMAADSFMGSEYHVLPRGKDDPKVFRHASGIIIGTCGTTIAQRKMRTTMLPVRKPGQDLVDFVFESLGPALANRVGEHQDFEFLLGIEGRLFRGFPNTLVVECVDGFSAIGSGGAHALGSLATPSDATPMTRVRRAVTIAERYIPTVRGPIVVVSGKATMSAPREDTPQRRSGEQWHDLDAAVVDIETRRRAA